jgi:hypothetical protein
VIEREPRTYAFPCDRYALGVMALEKLFSVFTSIDRAATAQSWESIHELCRAGRDLITRSAVCLD